MSPVYSLEPLVVGVFPSFPLDRFLYGAEPGTTLAAPCLAWLARGSDGSTILVDTGPPAPTARTAGLHQELQVNAEHRIDAALRARGVDPAEVGTVILTHLHFDHSAHLDLLPRARFLVQRAEIRYAAAPADKQRRGYEVGYDGVIPHWTRAFDRLERAADDVLASHDFRMISGYGAT